MLLETGTSLCEMRGEKASLVQGTAGNLYAKAVRDRGASTGFDSGQGEKVRPQSLSQDVVRKQDCLHVRDLSSKVIE